jgi:hypothetical protein
MASESELSAMRVHEHTIGENFHLFRLARPGFQTYHVMTYSIYV